MSARDPADLVDSARNTPGVACPIPWCNASTDTRKDCGDHAGDYAGLTHRARLRRALILHPTPESPK